MVKESLNFNNAFVTVGTTKFTKLIDTVVNLDIIKILMDLNVKNVTIQTGNDWSADSLNKKNVGFTKISSDDNNMKMFYSTSSNQNIEFLFVKYVDNFEEEIKNSDLIISHGGAGTCLDVLHQNKPLIIVVNEDLMDNHQIELAEQLQVDGYAYYCNCDSLKDVLLNFTIRKPYPVPDKDIFSKYLNKCMGFT